MLWWGNGSSGLFNMLLLTTCYRTSNSTPISCLYKMTYNWWSKTLVCVRIYSTFSWFYNVFPKTALFFRFLSTVYNFHWGVTLVQLRMGMLLALARMVLFVVVYWHFVVAILKLFNTDVIAFAHFLAHIFVTYIEMSFTCITCAHMSIFSSFAVCRAN